MMNNATCGQKQRVLVVRLLRRRNILRGFQDRSAGRIISAVLLWRHNTTGDQVVAVALAVIGIGRKHQGFIGPVFAIWVLVVARPRNARTLGKLLVTQARIIARPPARTFLP